MNDDAFEMGVRRFLKEFGIAAQRELEAAVTAGMAAGTLNGAESVRARARLEIPALGTFLDIERDLPLA